MDEIMQSQLHANKSRLTDIQTIIRDYISEITHSDIELSMCQNLLSLLDPKNIISNIHYLESKVTLFALFDEFATFGGYFSINVAIEWGKILESGNLAIMEYGSTKDPTIKIMNK